MNASLHEIPSDSAGSPLCELSPLQKALVAAGAMERRVRGILRIDARHTAAGIRAAFAQVIADWEVLRTCYVEQFGQTFQTVADAAAIPPALLPAMAALAEMECVWSQLTDCTAGVRAGLMPWNGGHLLLIAVTAASFDAPSMAILADALARSLDGAPADSPMHYADVAAWMTDAAAEPLSIALPMAAQGRGESLDIVMIADASSPGWRATVQRTGLGLAVRRTAQATQSSLCAVIAALWITVLRDFSTDGSVHLGVILDGRPLADLNACPGRFAWTYPVWLSAEHQPTLRQQIVAMDRQLGQAAEWALRFDLPLRLTEGGARPPPFTLAVQNVAEETSVHAHSCADESLDGVLHLHANAQPDGEIAFEWRFDAARFDADAVAVLVDRFVARVMAAALPQQCDALADALGSEELARLAQWVRPSRSAADVTDVLALFQRTVTACPERTALSDATRSLSYVELAQHVRQMAQYLSAQGIRRGCRIAIRATDPMVQVVAMLAAFECGAAFVPIDPAWPTPRVDALLSDAEVGVCIDEAIAPDAHADAVERIAAENAAHLPAYLVYTSGSTGTPKGVMVGRGQLARYVASISSALAANGPLVWVGIGTFAADLTYTALFGALATGGELRLIDQALLRDTQRLLESLVSRPPDVLKTVPSLIASLLELEPSGRFLPRRHLLMGGEALPPGLTDAIVSVAPACHVINHYGPTETTIGVVINSAAADPRRRGVGASVIGRPLPHAGIRVVDARDRMMGIGQSGEIVVHGLSIADGYRNAPAKTALSFVPDAWSDVPGARCYRTGDLGRWLPDGRLEFLGRIDRQIKFNGFRIELAEIEQCLRSHPAVQDACVVAVRSLQGSVIRLHGFVAPSVVDSEQLLAHCKSLLPAAMIPATVEALAQLPRLTNAKLDRSGLESRAAQVAMVEPDYGWSLMQRRVGGVLAAVLGRSAVGPQEDFFAVGGNSILAIRAIGALNREFGCRLRAEAIFEHPTCAGLAEAIEQWTPSAPPIVRVERTEWMPLSPAQEQLWIAAQLLEPGALTIPLRIHLAGAVDPTAIDAALRAVMQRHEILQTRIVNRDGVPLARTVALPAQVVERSDQSSDGSDSEFLTRAFDLATEAPLRARLIAQGEGHWQLLLSFHHIAVDAWSLELFLREFVALLDGARLDALSVQYADFTAWQRSLLAGAQGAALRDRWQHYLADSSPRITLDPTFETAAAVHGSAVVRGELPADVLDALRSQAAVAGVSLFAVLMGGFCAVLRKLTGDSDLVVGTPIADRPAPELEGLIGLFFQVLPMRLQLHADASVADLWRQVHGELARLWSMRDVPFDVLALANPRSDDRLQPWFNVVFTQREAALDHAATSGTAKLEARIERPQHSVGHYDVFCAVETSATKAVCVLEYRRDRVSAAAASRLIEWLIALLTEMAKHPATPLRSQILGTLPAAVTLAKSNAHPTLFEQLAAWVADDPHAPALRAETDALTRRALAQRVDRLAAALLTRYGTGDSIAVRLSRGVDLVVALLAVWRAGMVYVPVDPSLPQSRQEAIIIDARPSLLFVDADAGAIADTAFAGVPCAMVRQLENAGETAPVFAWPQPSPLQPAYLIYTSGSTGRPKGVAVPWSAFEAFVAEMSTRLALTPADTLFATSSISFDISLLELVLPLACGGIVHIARANPWQDPDYLVAALTDATVMQATPSAWQMLLGYLDRITLRMALVGGEAVPRDLATALYASADAVWNMYGPTEATIWVAAAVVSATAPRGAGGTVDIAAPLPGTRWSVRDDDGQPCPVGMPGELVLAGSLIGAGYHGLPRMTAERFVPDEAGSRQFLSGDRVVRLADGRMRFLGRRDGMVKLRGYRIEFAEIEAGLRAADGVAAAAAYVIDDRLFAAVVPSAGAACDMPQWGDQLRATLATRLPAYMVPSQINSIDALPTSSSGKLDRRRLPQPVSRQDDPPCSTPLTPVQAQVAEAFAALLGQQPASSDDDFFALGGTSLLAARLVAQLGQRTGVTLPLREIFRDATVRGIAWRLQRAGVPAVALPVLVPSRRDRGPLSPYQAGIWAGQRRGDMGSTYHISTTVVLHGPLDRQRLRSALTALCNEQDQLRCVIAEEQGGLLQYASAEVRLELIDVDATAAPVDETALLREWRAQRFDLAYPGYCRFGLIRRATDVHVLSLVLHHLIADEWSWRIVLDRLQAHYLAADAPARPEAADTLSARASYIDYAALLHDERTAPWFTRQAQFWRDTLQGSPPLLELVSARPRPARRQFRGEAIDVALDARATRALQKLANEQTTSLFTVLTAVYAVLLHAGSGRHDVLIGTAAANRRLAGTEDIVGQFSNVLALRLAVDPQAPFRALVERAADTVLAALDHQEYPFADVVQQLGVQPSAAFAPVVQNFIVFHNTPKARPASPWQVQTLAPHYAHSEYDLDLGLDLRDGALEGYLRYNRDVYDRRDMTALVAQFCRLIDRIAVTADTPVGLLCLPAESAPEAVESISL
ncbi:non-ribosomal peptide synthetase [Tahibacter sp.]|uniref:non-ribosomal peptide synthetase n=1 Tax=Tahibacter sp. TaxID=2056211 RepID=UPI0028C493F4|nr:non-ribosomal peptide synthetase [Tahibacter sp.]